jgi:hypothetical protein
MDADSFNQSAPMLEVALSKLPEILRREIDALEAVSPEELRGLGMIQCLGHVGVNLRKKIRRHFSWPPRPEPHRCIEGGIRTGTHFNATVHGGSSNCPALAVG